MGRPPGSKNKPNKPKILNEKQAETLENEPLFTETSSSVRDVNDGPAPMPSPKKLTRTRTKQKTGTVNQLPENQKEFSEAILPCKVMVRPVLHAISKLCEVVHTDALDEDELESGNVAFAALMYQYGAMLDARVLVALWVAGVSIPRIPQAIDYVRAKRTKLVPVPEVQTS